MEIQPFTYVAFYFVVWWTVLFAVLPFGVRTQHDEGKVEHGTEPGAPLKAYLWQKALATTIIAAIVTLLLIWGISNPALQEYWS